MPCDKSKYPKDWKEIRAQILDREGHKCKWCGTLNYSVVAKVNGERIRVLSATNYNDARAEAVRFGFNAIVTVLTIAHIDNPDPMDCRPENLAALCQRCHNRHDAPMRAANRKAKREAAIAHLPEANHG